MRPENIPHRRLLIFYKDGKCTKQPVGLHTFGKIPQKIALFLNLANPELYTGHCLRRSSATLLVNGGASITNLKRHGGWKSANIAEGYIETSIRNKIDIANKIQSGSAENCILPGTSKRLDNMTHASFNNTIEPQIDSADNIFGSSQTFNILNQKNFTNTVEVRNDKLSDELGDLPSVKIINPSNCTFNFTFNK